MSSAFLSARLGRLGLSAVLLIVSAILVAPILLSLSSGEAALALHQALRTTMIRLALVAGGLGLTALLVWPPVLPHLRLWWRRVLQSGQADSAAVQEAVARLRNFDNPADRITVARAFVDRGDDLASLEHWMAALKQEPDSLAARDGLGRASARLGRHEEAIGLLESIRREQPDYGFGDVLRILGASLIKTGRAAEAEEVLAEHEAIAGIDRRVDLLRMRAAELRSDRAEAERFRSRAASPLAPQEKVQPEMALARARAKVARFGGAR